jgi:hypothetical protein
MWQQFLSSPFPSDPPWGPLRHVLFSGFRAPFPWKQGSWSAKLITQLHFVPRLKNVHLQLQFAAHLHLPIYQINLLPEKAQMRVGAVVSSSNISGSFLHMDTDYPQI